MRNDWADLPLHRLDDLGDQSFAEVLINRQRLVAMVGSGLSLIYGGVDWATSVVMGLNHAISVIDRLLGVETISPVPETNDRQRLMRHREALVAFLDNGALASAADRYLALDLCSEALSFVDRLERTARGRHTSQLEAFECQILSKARHRHPDISRFHAYMATLYKNDTLLVRHLLAQRFALIEQNGRPASGVGARELHRRLEALEDRQVHRLARHVYRIEQLRDLASGDVDAIKLVDELSDWLEALKEKGWTCSAQILPVDRRAVLSLLLATIAPDARHAWLDRVISELFENDGSPGQTADTEPFPHRPLLDPIQSIERWFGIRRFITLNFDYQLEQALMLEDHCATGDPPDGLESAIDQRLVTVDHDTGALERRFPDGQVAASDVYAEHAVGRLFEFALNSPDYRTHLLHLHGRADRPKTMILTDSDSNRRYRRDPEAAGLLEQALDVTLTGNPILFIGIGLSEPEITRALRELVSRSNAGPDQPAFAVQAVRDPGSTAWRQQQAYLRQYGIHLLTAGVPASLGPAPKPAKDWRCAAQFKELAAAAQVPAPADADLAAAEQVLKALTDHVRALEQSLPPRPPLDLLQRARSLWFCGPDRLWIDNSVFLWLLDRIAQQTQSIHQWQADRWCDYLDKLKSKLNTLVVVERLRRLRDVVQARLETPLLAAAYDEEKLGPSGHGASTAMLLRDAPLSEPANPGEFITRHMSDPVNQTTSAPVPDPASARAAKRADQCDQLLADACAAQFVSGPLGSGKGSLARQLKLALTAQQAGTGALFINLTFGIEIDSVVSHIVRFLAGRPGAAKNAGPHITPIPLTDRITRLRALLDAMGNQSPPTDRPTIVIWGLERLLDRHGRAIAAELELLLAVLLHERLARAGLRLILIGAPNCAALLEAVARRGNCRLRQRDIDPTFADGSFLVNLHARASEACKEKPPLTSLRKQLDLANAAPDRALVPGGARSLRSSRLLRLVIDRWHDMAGGTHADAEIDRALLGALAIIGMPVEAEALRFMPVVSRALGDQKPNVDLKMYLDRLRHFGLALAIEDARLPEVATRYVLHRSVLAELRENISARSGEESISNSFSLTLGVSLPTDLKVPEHDVLADLELALGRLRGVWKEPIADKDLADALVKLRDAAARPADQPAFTPQMLARLRAVDRLERAVRMTVPSMSVCQRAAAGIIRGFFSSASLVAQFPMAHPFRNVGVMEAHKRRIGALLDQVREAQQAEKEAKTLVAGMKALPEFASESVGELVLIEDRLKTLSAPPTPPLYGNEILWLINEQANIAVIQGCLPEAERLLDQALAANACFRTAKEGSTSWRRLQINRLFVMIERGRLTEADALLDRIMEKSIQRRIQIGAENALVAPLLASYRGLIAHLHGRLDDAEAHLHEAIAQTRATGQQRAQAVSLIRLASLQFGRGQLTAGNATIANGIAMAETGRQMDIVWRARLTGCAGRDHSADKDAIGQTIAGALAYADYMAIPRLRVQAQRLRGDHLIKLGDLEGAARATAAAMAVAARHGMVLQRIGLRVQMGRILKQQRDPSAPQLLERAASLADRVGYQLMVERALAALGRV